jgi:multidrug efflux system membrane fusion protein
MMPRRTIGILIAILVAGGFAGWHFTHGVTAAQAADPAPEPPAVPVTTAKALLGDVPVLLDGLGTVQAFNVVEIKAQVSGTLVALPAREGQEVHKGDLIAEIDPRPYQAALDQANAKQQEDAATLQSAQLDLRRYQSLARSSFAPVQQVDDQQATVSKTQATIAADNAAIETAKINLGYSVIHAPFDGRVSLYQVDVGNLIETGSQTGIVSITQDKPIAVVFTLPEADLARIQDARQKGPVPVLVSDSSNTDTNGSKPLAKGTLLTPNNTIDTTTGTISLKAEFPNDDDHLWPGEFVNARLQVTILHNAVTIPLPAVEHGPNGLFVYMVKPDQTIGQTMIQVGYEDNGRAVVTKGLSGNETVVVTGQSRLAPGTKVKATDIANAPAAQAGSDAPG